MKINIIDKGASPEKNASENQKAIQGAIDEVSASGGGTVLVPCGTFLSGTLFLKDNVLKVFEAGTNPDTSTVLIAKCFLLFL